MRKRMMGGGMMGRRMGYSKGSNGKPISRSKNPGILAMSKTAKGRKVVKEKFKFNPDRVVAKEGGIKYANKQKAKMDLKKSIKNLYKKERRERMEKRKKFSPNKKTGGSSPADIFKNKYDGKPINLKKGGRV